MKVRFLVLSAFAAMLFFGCREEVIHKEPLATTTINELSYGEDCIIPQTYDSNTYYYNTPNCIPGNDPWLSCQSWIRFESDSLVSFLYGGDIVYLLNFKENMDSIFVSSHMDSTKTLARFQRIHPDTLLNFGNNTKWVRETISPLIQICPKPE